MGIALTIYLSGLAITTVGTYLVVRIAKMLDQGSAMDVVYSFLAGIFWPLLLLTGIISLIFKD